MAKYITKPILIASVIGTVSGGLVLTREYIFGSVNTKNLDAKDKVVIVTGASSGIGKATVEMLAKMNAKVIMACRDNDKCEKVRESIVIDTRNKYIYCRKCDLSSAKSIRKFAEKFKKEHNKLDVLINNAGLMECPLEFTAEGIEMQLGVNHMGHFLLTNLLLDKLKESAPSRIVVLSDVAYTKGEIKLQDLNSSKNYDPTEAYRQSKLANMMFVRELDKKLQGTNVTVNAIYPGITETELLRYTSFAKSSVTALLVKPFTWPFIKSPRQSAFSVLYVALDENLKNVSGKCFKAGFEELEISENAKDDKISKWLWLVSEKWTSSSNQDVQ